MDGLTCSLRYVDGRLVSAETRGNGVEGEDILHNARIIHNIPQAISYREELIIDGEIICDLETFENFKDDFANARNFAAGKIRTLDPHDCAKGNLSFIAWDVIKGFDNEKRLSDKLFDLENKINIDTVPFVTWDGAFDFEEISKVLKECNYIAILYGSFSYVGIVTAEVGTLDSLLDLFILFFLSVSALIASSTTGIILSA